MASINSITAGSGVGGQLYSGTVSISNTSSYGVIEKFRILTVYTIGTWSSGNKISSDITVNPDETIPVPSYAVTLPSDLESGTINIYCEIIEPLGSGTYENNGNKFLDENFTFEGVGYIPPVPDDMVGITAPTGIGTPVQGETYNVSVMLKSTLNHNLYGQYVKFKFIADNWSETVNKYVEPITANTQQTVTGSVTIPDNATGMLNVHADLSILDYCSQSDFPYSCGWITNFGDINESGGGGGGGGGDGILSITSSPTGANIFVDGTKMGNAPVDLTLPAGTYSVKATLSGYSDQNKVLRVYEGKPTKFLFSMSSPCYVPNTMWACELYWDVNGVQNATLVSPGALIESDAEVGNSTTSTKSSKFGMLITAYEWDKTTPYFTSPWIYSSSQSIAVDDSVMFYLDYRLPPEIDHGYFTIKFYVQGVTGSSLNPETTHLIQLNVEKPFAVINANSNPEGAIVLLDGMSQGVTPKSFNATEGGHTLTFQKTGFNNLTVSKTLYPGEVWDVNPPLTAILEGEAQINLTTPTSVVAGSILNYSVEVVNIGSTTDQIRFEVDLTNQNNTPIDTGYFEGEIPATSHVKENYTYSIPADGSVTTVHITARSYHWVDY